MKNFDAFLDRIENSMKIHRKEIILGGEFNSKSVEWDSPNNDARRRRLVESAAREGLLVANEGNKLTFVRGEQNSSYRCDSLFTKIKNWRVSDDENLRDHQNIMFEQKVPTNITEAEGEKPRWKTYKESLQNFGKALKTRVGRLHIQSALQIGMRKLKQLQ